MTRLNEGNSVVHLSSVIKVKDLSRIRSDLLTLNLNVETHEFDE